MTAMVGMQRKRAVAVNEERKDGNQQFCENVRAHQQVSTSMNVVMPNDSRCQSLINRAIGI